MGDKKQVLQEIAEKIQKANSLVLSTHRQADGDGLGAQIALYHALKKQGKNVRILNVDPTPDRYSFLQTEKIIQNYESPHTPLEPSDMALIFDTNDERLLAPLFEELENQCKEVIFVDHHPLLRSGPKPKNKSYIDTKAASTGEIVFHLIRMLNISLDKDIARALYTSIVFDTQLFRYIRGSAESHRIVAELLQYEDNPSEVHQRLFGNHTIQKVTFLSKALSQIEYFAGGKLAFLKIQDKDLLDHALNLDEARDVIDLIMNIDTLEAAILFREDGVNYYKVSLRSKGQINVLDVAEELGGGGHLYASGAFVKGSYDELKERIVNSVLSEIRKLS